MKKITTILFAAFFAVSFIISCHSSETKQTEGNTNTSVDSVKSDNQTITVKFIEANALEAEAQLVFDQADGNRRIFYRNYTNPAEPELKYMFIGEDGMSANKEFVGSTFKITFRLNPKGKISVITGEAEPCYQILNAEIIENVKK
jgi:hypothetical protein